MARSERSIKTIAISVAICIGVAVMVSAFVPGGNFILLGWLIFLIENLPQATFRWEGWLLFFTGTAALVVLVHSFAKWLSRSAEQTQAATSRSGTWRWRSSILLVASVYVMFIAGLAATGIVHQIGWLANAPSDWYVTRVSDEHWPHTRDFQAEHRLKMLGIAMMNAQSADGSFPSGTLLRDGTPLHSWVTQSVYYLSLQLGHDPEKPWLHEDNVEQFRKPMLDVLNPRLDAMPVRNADGFALAHYAGNSRVLKVGQKTKELPGSTLLIGEVNSRFKAWGDPTNLRDPWLGLNRHPDGFGGPAHSRTVRFATADGSVQEIDQDIDAKVLQRLSVGK